MTTKYIAVKIGTSAEQVNIAGDSEAAIGILLTTAPAIGDSVEVGMLGIYPVKANAAFAKDAMINSVAATGKVGTAAATERVLGIAMEAATAQNDEVACFVAPFWYAT
jgi:hypothetical protein